MTDKSIPKFEDTKEVPVAFENTEAPEAESEITPIESALGGVKSGTGAALDAAHRTGGTALLTGFLAATGHIDTETAIEATAGEFNAHKKEINEELKAQADANPMAFHGADFASSMLMSGPLAPLKGASFINKAGHLVAGGAASGLLRSDAPMSVEGATDALVGGSAGAIFSAIPGAGKLVAKAGKKAGQTAGNITGEFLTKVGKTKYAKKLNQHLALTKETVSQFGQKMLQETDDAGRKIFRVGATTDEIYEGLDEARQTLGTEYGKLLNGFDDVPKTHIKAQDLYLKLKSSIVNTLAKSDEPDIRQAANVADDLLKSSFAKKIELDKLGNELIEWGDDWAPARVQQLAIDNNKFTQSVFTSSLPAMEAQKVAIKASIATELRDIVELQLAKDVGEGGAQQAFKEIKKRYGRIVTAHSLLSDQKISDIGGPIGALKNALSLRGTIPGTIMATSSKSPITTVIGVSATINSILGNPRLQSSMAVGLKNMSNFIARNPESAISSRLTLAANSTADRFRTVLASSIGEVDLLSDPVERTTEAAKERQEALIAVSNRISSDLGAGMKKAFQEGSDEDIAIMMDALSKEGSAKHMVVKGQGWDGKLYSPEEKQAAEDSLETQNMSYSQLLFHKAAIKTNGTIPQVEQEEEPFFKWKSNKNEKPSI